MFAALHPFTLFPPCSLTFPLSFPLSRQQEALTPARPKICFATKERLLHLPTGINRKDFKPLMQRGVLDLDPIQCTDRFKCGEGLEVWNAEHIRAFQNYESKNFLFNTTEPVL